jgi:hypothetical protein
MADLEDRYYEIAVDVVAPGVGPRTVTSGRWLKVGIALIGVSCLMLASIVVTSVSSPTRQSTSASESTSLFGFATSRNVNNVNNQGKLYEFGLRPVIQTSPTRWSSVPAQAKVEDASEVKRSWDIGRFAKTAGEFGYLKPPNPIKVINGMMGSSTAMTGRPIAREEIIYSAVINPLKLVFRPLDDVVMGGSSKSSFDDTTGLWSGEVITEGAGFVGIRTRPFEPPLDLSRCNGLRLKVKGQGQRFKLIVRDDDQFNGIAWSYSFDTNPWFDTDVKIPLEAFVPTKFARVVEPKPTLNVATISALQITYSKFEYGDKLNPKFKAGDFKLVLKEIDTF